MFTAAGLEEAHTWRLCFLQEVSASVLFRRYSGLGKWPARCQVTSAGAKMDAPVGMLGDQAFLSIGAPLPLHGHNTPWRPPPLFHGDVLCLSLPLSALVGKVRLSEAPAPLLWCRYCLSFLERLQGGCHQGPVAGARCRAPWLS